MEYTEEQLRTIDRLVTEKVMGWRVEPYGLHQGDHVWLDNPENYPYVAEHRPDHLILWTRPQTDGLQWHPTTDRDQAMMVFEKCPWMVIRHQTDGRYLAIEAPNIDTKRQLRAGGCAPTPMLAICMAALKRADVEVPQ